MSHLKNVIQPINISENNSISHFRILTTFRRYHLNTTSSELSQTVPSRRDKEARDKLLVLLLNSNCSTITQRE
jgi:hypothetical protein